MISEITNFHPGWIVIALVAICVGILYAISPFDDDNDNFPF